MRASVHPGVAHQQHVQARFDGQPPGEFPERISNDGGRLEIHAESNRQAQGYESLPVAKARMASWAIVAIVVAGVVLLITSRRGLPTALAGLGIIAGLIVMYGFMSTDVRTASTLVPEVRSPVLPSTAPPVQAPASVAASDTHAPVENERASSKGAAEPTSDTTTASTTVARTDTSVAEKNEPRPAWVSQSPRFDKEAGVYRVDVVSGPYSTEEECERRLDAPLQGALMTYAERYLRPAARHYAWWDAQFSRDRIIKDRYLETTQASFGPMLKLHVLVEIGQSDVARYERLAYEADIRDRVAITGLFGASLVGVLAIAYGALRYVGRKKPKAADPAADAPVETTA
jgi:hypothetical protein